MLGLLVKSDEKSVMVRRLDKRDIMAGLMWLSDVGCLSNTAEQSADIR